MAKVRSEGCHRPAMPDVVGVETLRCSHLARIELLKEPLNRVWTANGPSPADARTVTGPAL